MGCRQAQFATRILESTSIDSNQGIRFIFHHRERCPQPGREKSQGDRGANESVGQVWSLDLKLKWRPVPLEIPTVRLHPCFGRPHRVSPLWYCCGEKNRFIRVKIKRIRPRKISWDLGPLVSIDFDFPKPKPSLRIGRRRKSRISIAS